MSRFWVNVTKDMWIKDLGENKDVGLTWYTDECEWELPNGSEARAFEDIILVVKDVLDEPSK